MKYTVSSGTLKKRVKASTPKMAAIKCLDTAKKGTKLGMIVECTKDGGEAVFFDTTQILKTMGHEIYEKL